ncbi:TadE/TadG family type IV pilus assembly protein [Luteimonas sp. e5]
MKAPANTRYRQRGQAMAEFAVACVVLVPLFLLIPIVAKYGHIRQQSQQATRNAAWAMTASDSHSLESAQQLRAQAVDRNFARADRPIRSTPEQDQGDEFESLMLNTFSGRKLVLREDLHVTGASERQGPGLLARIFGALPSQLPGEFPPNRNGYVEVTTRIDVRNLQGRDGQPARYLAPFDNLGLQMNGRQVLFVDAWNAAGSGVGQTGSNHRRSVMRQVDTLVPASNLREINRGLDAIGSIPLPIIGRLDDLDLGYVEPDIVPEDRLKRYAPRSP